MDEFGDGMNKVNGLFGRIKANPLLYEELFVDRRSLRMAEFMEICTYVRSDEGTNKRQKEDETIYAWELLLLSIEDGEASLTFEEVLVFVTGADRIPVGGFHKTIDILFYDMQACHHYPFTSTCALTLHLPRAYDADNFGSFIEEAIRCSPGFGKC